MYFFIKKKFIFKFNLDFFLNIITLFAVQDTLEIQAGVLKKGQRVFLLDDLLATGGTLKAAVDLIQQSDSIVSQIAVFIELNSLNGRNLFSKDLEIFSFLKY